MSTEAASITLLVARYSNTDYMYKDRDRRGIRIISFATSALSIISCLLAFFWLHRLQRRVFRHTLIVLLIFFDFLRAIILFWYPIRLWYTGEDSIGPHACQADGFFAALSVEASDFGVLVIAVHTLMFIMYPQVGSSSAYKYGGLYRYRRIVYILWAAFAILFASLPFVKASSVPDNPITTHDTASLGYIQLLTWCYLPVQPIWYRLVLAWIPRYLVLISICIIYVRLYIYVRKILRAVDNVYTRSPETPRPDAVTAIEASRGQRQIDIEKEERAFDEPLPPNFDLAISPLDPFPLSSNVHLPAGSTSPSVSQSLGNDRSGASGHAQGQFVTPRYLNNVQMESTARDRQRAFIERQVKYLLLYPIFYVIMWAAPFVSQCLMYSPYFVENPVVWLGYLTACMYAISGFLNTIIFAIRETPWRRERRLSETMNTTIEPDEMEEPGTSDHSNDGVMRRYVFWVHRKLSNTSTSDSFRCLRRISETSAISIEKFKSCIGKVFGRPREHSSLESTPEGPTPTLGTRGTPEPLPSSQDKRRLASNMESGNKRPILKTIGSFNGLATSQFTDARASSLPIVNETVARPIRSAYDIMKIEAPPPKHVYHKTSSREWWDRLDELEDDGTLRMFRKNHFVSGRNSDISSQNVVGDGDDDELRRQWQSQSRRTASGVLPDRPDQTDEHSGENPSSSDNGSKEEYQY
ncbi:G protein-coupled glucose receptor regulating Gpa2-domain-containing protein [Lipomyces tetrasporus]|uniref:G protein-coupled glucose receptor regulating Gpa2-domain-containing protein n=1 Tax=Lipomyces tetrasporus TaxID=54092 RepID=A0AAD7VUP4_9ASCO|nr:G protein-coupled glucose receptor regulating Gpa2-domain-containing protein [Lipomyces tetrasporus]KAJ8102668.1 G protein-coupled glucose receptor regulating Gpa2-domain-containing protein [Lipomyces tetrasporus]